MRGTTAFCRAVTNAFATVLDAWIGLADPDFETDESFARAEKQHGDRFRKAWEALMGLDPLKPEHRRIVQNIVDGPDPGTRLMEVFGGAKRSWSRRNAWRSPRTLG